MFMDIDILLILQEFRNEIGAILADFFSKMTFIKTTPLKPLALAMGIQRASSCIRCQYMV